MTNLDPKFVFALVQLMATPHYCVDVVSTLWFTEMKEEFNIWVEKKRTQGIPLKMGNIYDWWQAKFPESPLRLEGQDPDECFRELLKYMLGEAMNQPYKPKSLIVH